MYLNKKDNAEIASIINSMIVARELWFERTDEFVRGECEYESVTFWKREYHKDVVRLSEYGIDMHDLDNSRAVLEELS